MPLTSHPVAQTEEDVDASSEEEEEHEEEHYTDDSTHIKVRQAPGFLCHIEASARIPLSPKTLWEQAIVHPDNAAIFRHMDRCTFRKVLSPFPPPGAPNGKVDVEVAHAASWRFLIFSGEFTTRLLVHEDHENFIMSFDLLPSKSIVSKFQGVWQVKSIAGDPNKSISILEQDIAIGLWAPPPIDRLLKSISCRQLRRIFEDLQTEAGRINRNEPTLVPYEKVKEKEIGCAPAAAQHEHEHAVREMLTEERENEVD